MKLKKRAAPAAILLAIFAVLAASPATARAQDAGSVDQARLTQFARAHIAINDARDEFHGQVARVHDEEGRRRAREEVDARIQEILEEQEMTQEEYDEFILLISLDGELRAAFDELVVQLQEEPSL
ncbi:MAG: DUF4168 domain-containing protein [Longimicrobiales bacterium]|nr:DUF4168 domain-containing protein [Longimicrobiales bacterium]